MIWCHTTKVIKWLIHLLFYNLINGHCNSRLYFNTFCISLFNKLICSSTKLCCHIWTKFTFYKSRRILRNIICILCHILFSRCICRIFFCLCCLIFRFSIQRLSIYDVFNSAFIILLAKLSFHAGFNLTAELISNLLLIHCVHFIINFIIMFMFLRTFCNYKLVIILTITISIALHNVGHIESCLMCNPVIQNKHFLNHCLCARILYLLQCFISFVCNGSTIKLDAKLIRIIEVLYHSHKVIKTILAISHLFKWYICQNQHLTQYSKTIFIFIIIMEEKW